MSVYNRNRNHPHRKPNWWIKYYVDGKEVCEAGKGTYKASKAWEVELKRQIKAGTWVHPSKRNPEKTGFANYAHTVLARRIARGVATAKKDERGHIENHLIPMFEGLRIDEVADFKLIKERFAKFFDGDHAGRTVRNIHATLRAILIEAAEDGLIPTAPTPLSVKRDHIPAPRDKDPEWRKTAHFEPHEVAQLVACADVLTMRRVIYATYFMTGSRAMEVLPLRVSSYIHMEPWPALAVRALKLGRHSEERTRYVPVFPELAAWIDWWLAHEYEVLAGHKPRPSDPLFPTVSVRRRNRGEQFCSHNEIYKQWQRHDLPAAQLRHRRLHDARRTYISALRSRQVGDTIIRAVTHSTTGDGILDAYTDWQWAKLCEALEPVAWGLPKPPPVAEVIHLPVGTPGVPRFSASSQTT
jgi:integrase